MYFIMQNLYNPLPPKRIRCHLYKVEKVINLIQVYKPGARTGSTGN